MHSMQTNGASKNQYWPGQMGTIFLCDFGITWCWFLGVSWGSWLKNSVLKKKKKIGELFDDFFDKYFEEF